MSSSLQKVILAAGQNVATKHKIMNPIFAQKRTYLDFSADYFTNTATPNHYQGSLKPQQEKLSKQYVSLSNTRGGIHNVGKNEQYTNNIGQRGDITSQNKARTTNKFINNDNIDPCYYMHLYGDMPVATVGKTANSGPKIAQRGENILNNNNNVNTTASSKKINNQLKNKEQIGMGFTGTKSTRNNEHSINTEAFHRRFNNNHSFNFILNNNRANSKQINPIKHKPSHKNNNHHDQLQIHPQLPAPNQYYLVSKPTAVGSNTQGYYDDSACVNYTLMSGCIFTAVCAEQKDAL